MSVVLNRVIHGAYMDSVALMRRSRSLAARPDVVDAAIMMGTPSNKGVLRDAGLLTAEGEAARPDDRIIAVRANDMAAAEACLASAETEHSVSDGAEGRDNGDGDRPAPRTQRRALERLPNAALALISVPGAFAAAEARKALRRGLHVMLFSDNVSVADEKALKELARAKGRLMLGPDCGTVLLGGAPLGFANSVARGGVGIVGASGTGIQEVSCLIDRAGGGVSHALGVGGRDLVADVGGIMTGMALDVLVRDPDTTRIVLLSKPPSETVAADLVDRLGSLGKPATVCFLGMRNVPEPRQGSVTVARTLEAAATCAFSGGVVSRELDDPPAAFRPGRLVGLFAGGTLCAEAQVVLLDAGIGVGSNAPVPGSTAVSGGLEGMSDAEHVLLDLGDDVFTRTQPHPMLDPAARNAAFEQALGDASVGTILFDVVLGHGAHEDPAGLLVSRLPAPTADRPLLVANVVGTERDPQGYSRQVEILRQVGVVVAPSNAAAARLAARTLV